jgi:hypothetical protein
MQRTRLDGHDDEMSDDGGADAVGGDYCYLVSVGQVVRPFLLLPLLVDVVLCCVGGGSSLGDYFLLLVLLVLLLLDQYPLHPEHEK